ncbi:copper homeostasis protein CutC [Lachnospiraceae bacterium OttesenSCG-928-J05]|nr:copper homeostasis protein CutC [Lachnospiraceae bacterium OttesenSCG-928-J05]
MKDYMLEICVDSVESAIAAQKGGAKRLELCSNLIIGGTTPTPSLYLAVREAVEIDINVLIRPRFGDFCYTEAEFGIIRRDIQTYRELGANGVVIGILRPEGILNTENMQILMKEAGEMAVTLHRAFDVCRDPFATMEESICLGIQTILTSGQESSALAGAKLLQKLEARAAGRIQILGGAGVTPANLEELRRRTGLCQFHMSGKKVIDSEMTFRKEGVPMGLPGLSEYSIWRTDEEEIKKAAEILERMD